MIIAACIWGVAAFVDRFCCLAGPTIPWRTRLFGIRRPERELFLK